MNGVPAEGQNGGACMCQCWSADPSSLFDSHVRVAAPPPAPAGPHCGSGSASCRSPTCSSPRSSSLHVAAAWPASWLDGRRVRSHCSGAACGHAPFAPQSLRVPPPVSHNVTGLLRVPRDRCDWPLRGVEFGTAYVSSGSELGIQRPQKARRSGPLAAAPAALPAQSACFLKNAGISISSIPLLASASTFAAACVRLVRHTLGVLRPS